MVERGVDVVDLNDLLAQILEDREARAWLLDRKVNANQVGVGMLAELRAWFDEMPATLLADHLIGGIAVSELPYLVG